MFKEAWTGFVKFLADYDINKLSDVIRHVKWGDFLSHPMTWIVGIPLLAIVFWKKLFRLLLVGVSFVLLILLLQYTSPGSGQQMSLDKLLTFLGGAVVLIGVNAYFLLIRDK
jgi:hypothetical protein